MFQFPPFAHVVLWIQSRVIQGSRDQLAFDQSPELIAVFHALHRLLAPRHPPHALSSLAALIYPLHFFTPAQPGLCDKEAIIAPLPSCSCIIRTGVSNELIFVSHDAYRELSFSFYLTRTLRFMGLKSNSFRYLIVKERPGRIPEESTTTKRATIFFRRLPRIGLTRSGRIFEEMRRLAIRFDSFPGSLLIPGLQVSARRSFPILWRRRGSNPQPPACKAGALPVELRPRYLQPGGIRRSARHTGCTWIRTMDLSLIRAAL